MAEKSYKTLTHPSDHRVQCHLGVDFSKIVDNNQNRRGLATFHLMRDEPRLDTVQVAREWPRSHWGFRNYLFGGKLKFPLDAIADLNPYLKSKQVFEQDINSDRIINQYPDKLPFTSDLQKAKLTGIGTKIYESEKSYTLAHLIRDTDSIDKDNLKAELAWRWGIGGTANKLLEETKGQISTTKVTAVDGYKITLDSTSMLYPECDIYYTREGIGFERIRVLSVDNGVASVDGNLTDIEVGSVVVVPRPVQSSPVQRAYSQERYPATVTQLDPVTGAQTVTSSGLETVNPADRITVIVYREVITYKTIEYVQLDNWVTMSYEEFQKTGMPGSAIVHRSTKATDEVLYSKKAFVTLASNADPLSVEHSGDTVSVKDLTMAEHITSAAAKVKNLYAYVYVHKNISADGTLTTTKEHLTGEFIVYVEHTVGLQPSADVTIGGYSYRVRAYGIAKNFFMIDEPLKEDLPNNSILSIATRDFLSLKVFPYKKVNGWIEILETKGLYCGMSCSFDGQEAVITGISPLGIKADIDVPDKGMVFFPDKHIVPAITNTLDARWERLRENKIGSMFGRDYAIGDDLWSR